MKVDKGVCTSNDAYFAGNTAAGELNSIIKFETVFTTLVENKILAIKRDCELHEAKKKEKSRTFKGILSKKSEADENNAEAGVEAKKKTRKNFFLRHKNKQSEIDVEKGEKRDNAGILEVPVEIATVELQNDKEVVEPVDSQSNRVDAAPGDDCGQPNCDTLITNSQAEHAQLTLTSTKDSTNVHSCKTIKETSPPTASNAHTDESLATTIDISLQSSVVKAAPIDSVQVVNDKSDVAICDDGASSQNTSDIEFSLVSESISELPSGVLKKSPTNSDPVKKKSALFLSPPLTREVKISERKTISCQSTPLFGRHQAKGEGEVKKVLTFQKELPKKSSETKPTEKVKSQTIVIAPTSTTTTTALAKPIQAASGPLENVHTSRKSQRHSKYRDVSVEYEISYDDNDGNQSPRGFISSFNQLTSQTPPAAVITTSAKKQASSSLAKSQSLKDGRAQQDVAADGKSDDKTAKNPDIELELDDLAVDVVNKKKRRRRQSSRCSDDAVIYPSSSGLKHCILSRPPNQPIQIEYDPDFNMYDVSLQIESEFNGDVKSIVPVEHKKPRHKHQHHDHERCKERRRRKKRKILVHNLDDKSLKVIDPDELPQRAKFTIIATACLLLIMCLLLVGITLRMAPLIDDMVRQENERLIQDSMIRARMAANYTDPPPLAPTTTSTPSHHPNLKMLQGNFVP